MASGRSNQQATSSTDTSRSLLDLAGENDPAAWDRLVELYMPLVYFWCQKMELPPQEMPDVFQEIFHSVARNISSFRHDQPGDTFRGWLRTVTRNKVIDFYRRNGREPIGAGGTDAQLRLTQIPTIELPEDSDPIDSPQGGQAVYRELYQQALTQIRPHFQEKTWTAFWRVVIDGRSAAEVAEELEMKPGTIRVAKSRVLHRLRKELGDA